MEADRLQKDTDNAPVNIIPDYPLYRWGGGAAGNLCGYCCLRHAPGVGLFTCQYTRRLRGVASETSIGLHFQTRTVDETCGRLLPHGEGLFTARLTDFPGFQSVTGPKYG